MLYRWKVRILQHPRFDQLWRMWKQLTGQEAWSRAHLPDLIRAYAPGRTFVDIGCMWGINGENSFIAEEAGATKIKAIDVFGPTPEFLAKHETRDSSVEFILGDLIHPTTIERIGICDVVLCAGVLYHHPSPFDVLIALRRVCGQTLILRTQAIPEIDGLPHAAVYWPMLPKRERRFWAGSSTFGTQWGITTPFRSEEGYGNWFWGLTPSCITALLQTAGFRVEQQYSEPFAQTFVCAPIEQPFSHRLPDDESEAMKPGEKLSI